MVNTVGPPSISAPPESTWRILPPGALAASITVTSSPRAASNAALVNPPTPAPITITFSRCIPAFPRFSELMSIGIPETLTSLDQPSNLLDI